MKRRKRLTKRQRRGAASFVAAVKAELAAHYAGALAAVKAWTP